MDSSKPITFSDLQEGHVYFVDGSRRVARMVGTKDFTLEQPDEQGHIQVKTVHTAKMEVVLPTKPMKGYVTERQAADNRRLAEAVEKEWAGSSREGAPDVRWTEYWGQRSAPVWLIREGLPPKLDSKHAYLQLFCHEVEGRADKRERTSPVRNCPVIARRVMSPPKGLFNAEDDKGQAPDEEAASPVEKGPGKSRAGGGNSRSKAQYAAAKTG